ncbi:MAG: aminotransferase class I/II-fold pyridoxal phosphate-dependent enzyme [Alphaproteobacteria bacterium]|nr:aminotransferase class I/II-fold pyridoxal phosphate-dependent enzyme [Alphaproteobacteria bacterium]
MSIDAAAYYPADPKAAAQATLNPIAATMLGSRILGIAAQVKAMAAEGAEICNLTVGDFSPEHFTPPLELRAELARHALDGQTNYPPSDGIPELKRAIADFYADRLGVRFPTSSIVVGSGARPPLYATLRCLLSPGDVYLYAQPSWNNEYYVHLNGARAVTVDTRAEDGFMPTLADLAPHLPSARVLHLNSPLNPCGTVIDPEVLREICQAVVDENRRREASGDKPLMLMYDMVYWMLTYGDSVHADPIRLVPEIAPYVIYIDAISKWFAATGLRVGWGVYPAFIQPKIKALIGHVGAWAPRPEQMALAWYLGQTESVDRYLAGLKGELQARLDCIHGAFSALAEEGFPVEAIAPQGAIYLSVRVNLIGRQGPDGETITTNEQIRELLLLRAGVAVVPFRAFGLQEENGWFRMSVGAVGLSELKAAMERLGALVRELA